MLCRESIKDAPPVKLIQSCDRRRVFRARIEGHTPRLPNIPRPILYPLISESQKAIPVQFFNPAWRLMYFCPQYRLRAMRSATGIRRSPQWWVRCLIASDQMRVPQLLAFEFDQMFGLVAKGLY
jgi:hypothetical protein